MLSLCFEMYFLISIRIVHAITRTVLLLNCLIFCADPIVDVRHKLQHAPHKQFNGITYMFIVTLGYLSYADPPDWASDAAKAQLERIAGVSPMQVIFWCKVVYKEVQI